MKGQPLINFDILRARLAIAQADALRVYEADKGTPCGAFDSGRYDGLKQAIEILDGLARYRPGRTARHSCPHDSRERLAGWALLTAVCTNRTPCFMKG
jgi:hypothetical protein